MLLPRVLFSALSFVLLTSTFSQAASGDLDPTFLTGVGAGITGSAYPETIPTGAVNAVALQPDGKILAGGNLSRHNNTGELTALKRLLPDGTLDPSFGPNTLYANGPHIANPEGGQAEINSIIVNDDGSFFISGVFENYGSDETPRVSLAKVNADGTLNTAFVPPVISNNGFGRYVQSLALDGQGGLLVAGFFSAPGKKNLIRVDAVTGALDTEFTASSVIGSTTSVSGVSVAADGRIYVSGSNGTPFVKRLLPNGVEDSSFYVSLTNGLVNKVLALPNGKVVISGDYVLGGQTEYDHLSGLTTTGALDTTFNGNLGSGPDGWVGGILQFMPDGRILAGGIFKHFDSTPVASLVILNLDGTRDATFTPVPYTTENFYLTHFYSAAVQDDGRIVVGGWLDHVTDPDLDIRNIVRFEGDSAEGPGSLKFSSPVYSALENGGSVSVQVVRTAGITGAVSVNYATGGGGATAIAGADYTNTSGTLNWADGEGGVKNIVIPILDNSTAAAAKTFRMALSSATGGAVIGNVGETWVTILDDDAVPTIVTPPQSVTLNQGANLNLTVTVDSTLPVTFQWQFLTGGGFANINGAIGRNLLVNQVTPEADSGQYRVIVSNANGDTASEVATVVVNVPAGSLVLDYPAASINPISKARYDIQGRIVASTTTTNTVIRLNGDGSLDATFTAPVFSSVINDILPLPNGQTLVGGFFTTVGGISRYGVARLNANGSLDENFNLGINFFVQSLGLGTGGKYYLGGTQGSGLKRYLANDTLDPNFVPVAIGGGGINGYVWAIRENGDGTMFVAHQLSAGGTLYRLSKLNVVDGSATSGFTSPVLSWNIYDWDFLPDGRIVIGGRFTKISDTTCNRVAILLPDGSWDTSFDVGAGPNNYVFGVKYLEGRILAWGQFSQVNGVDQSGVARFNLDGSNDPSFVVGSGGGPVNSMLLATDADFLLLGQFNTFNGIPRKYVAKLIHGPGAVGFEPTSYSVIEGNPTVELTVRRYGSADEAASVHYETADGTALADTDYTAKNGLLTWSAGDASDRNISITLLNNAIVENPRTFQVDLTDPTGNVLPAASASVTMLDDDTPVSFTTQPVGASLLTGDNLSLTGAATSPTPMTYQWYRNGVPVSGATSTTLDIPTVALSDAGLYVLVATNAAGSFNSNAAQVIIAAKSGRIMVGQATTGRPIFSNNQAQAIVALDDGGALVGGSFTTNVGNNINQSYLIRIRPDGSTDTSFSLAVNSTVFSLLRQPDGKILVAGNFSSPSGRLMRLNADATLSLDTSFNTNVGSAISVSGNVSDLALDSLGRVYACTNAGNPSAIYRFAADGTPDSGYSVTANSSILAIAVQNDDNVLASGSFTQIASSSVSRFARLNTDGTRDTSFTSGLGGSAGVNDLLVLKDGRIFVAGSNFSNSATLALVNSDGTFGSNMGSGSQVYELSQSPTGKVVVVRTSSNGNGSIYRIKASNPLPIPGSADGDATFSVGLGPNGDVKMVSHATDGSIWIAGNFNSFDGLATGNVVRLQGDPGNPGIVNPPVTLGVNGGATAQFSVGAVGTGLTYHWYKDGVALVDDQRISGAQTAVLSIANVSGADDDFYTVEVTGGTPSDTVSSDPTKLNVLYGPVVVSSPGDQTPDMGSTLVISADVLAATPASYVWRRDGVLIQNGGRYSGADTATLVIGQTNNADNGIYTLTITNTLGSASTDPATVTVNQVSTDRVAALVGVGASSTNSSNYINAFLHLPDGRTLIGSRGNVIGNGSTTVGNQLAVVETDGRVTGPLAGNFSGSSSSVNGFFLQSDGKILVFGNYTSVGNSSGAGKNRLSRLNADLSLDTSFIPVGPTSAPTGGVTDSQGRVYLAGGFFSYDGNVGYNYLVRLKPDGSLDTSFKLQLSNSVASIRLQSDGKILVAGGFSSYGPFETATNVPGLLRLNANGTVDSGFTAQLPEYSYLSAMTVDNAGRIIVARNNTPADIIRLLPNGQVDPSFTFTETLSSYASTLAALPDGKVLVGGSFTTPTNRFFRLNANGSLDSSFDVGVGFNSGSISAIEVDFQGRLWVAGQSFTSYKGVNANRMVILQGDGPNLKFITHPASRVVDLGTASVQFTASATGNNGFSFRWNKNGTPLTDGGRVSGALTNTLTISNITSADAALYTVTATSPSASLSSNAALLTVLAGPEITSDPLSQTVDIGGTVTFTGSAVGAGTLTYQWLLFGNTVSNGDGITGATTPTLTLTGVDFDNVGDYSLRVTNNLGTATTAAANLTVEKRPGNLVGDKPQPRFNGDVHAIHIFADGSYLVGGRFTTVSIDGGVSTSRNRLARFLPDGSLDPNFSPTFNNDINAIEVDSAGRIFVGGNFTSVIIGGITTNVTRVARFTVALQLDSAFDTSTAGPSGGTVNALAPLGNGSVYVGGTFTSVGAVSTADVRGVVRLGANGSLDTGFKSQLNANGVINTLLLRGNKLLIGGQYNTWGTSYGTGAGMVLVSATGAMDAGFSSPGILTGVTKLAELSDGNLFAGQNASGNYAQRYHPTNGSSLGFIPDPKQPVYAVAQQADNKLMIGGLFNTSFGSVLGFANFLYRAAPDGTVDTTFDIGTGFNNSVKALALDSQGRIYVGGAFTTLGGVSQNRFVILNGGDYESRDGYLPSQTITFTGPANRTFNPAANTLPVTATSSSGLPVSIAVTSGPATITGNTVTITGAGEVTLTATQAGSANFAAAAPVVRSFTVAKASQTINFAALSDRSMLTMPFAISATASSGLTVSLELVSGPASLNGNTLTLNGTVGTVTLRATQAGDANYEAASPVERSFQTLDIPAEPEPQSITFAAIANRAATDGAFTLSATASSGLAVSFELVSGPATLDGTTLTPTGVSGTVTIRATQAGDPAWLAAAPVSRSFYISGSTPPVPVAQKITFVPPTSRYLDEGSIELSAIASSGLPVIFEVISGPATLTGTNTLRLDDVGFVTISATQPGNPAFLEAKAVVKKIKILATPSKLTLTNLVQTYDGSPHAVGYLGVDEETEVTITYAGSETPPTDAGSYAVVAQAGKVKKTGKLIIHKAPVTITADDQRKLAGQPNPELTYQYSGFFGADTAETVVTKEPTIKTTAKDSSKGGLYPIKLAGGVASNYAFILIHGTLTVEGFDGKYEALLADAETQQATAKIEITVSTSGQSFSGKLTTPTELSAVPFKGSLITDPETEESTGTAIFSKGGNSYELAFTLPLQGAFEASLLLNDEEIGITDEGQKLLVLAKGEKLAYVGTHTMILSPAVQVPPSGEASIPEGSGYATATVDTKGVLKFVGVLADGTKLTAALYADSQAGYRLMLLPYKRLDSYLAGWIDLEDHPDLEDLKYVDFDSEMDLTWAKAENSKDKSYRAGFGVLATRLTLDPWLPPTKASKTLPEVSLIDRLGLQTDGEMSVEYTTIDSESFPDLASLVALDGKNKVSVLTPEENATKWKISVNIKTGAFKGSFVLSDAKSRTVPFAGVMRQPPSTDMSGEIGAGAFLLPALPTDASNEILSGDILFTVPSGL